MEQAAEGAQVEKEPLGEATLLERLYAYEIDILFDVIGRLMPWDVAALSRCSTAYRAMMCDLILQGGGAVDEATMGGLRCGGHVRLASITGSVRAAEQSATAVVFEPSKGTADGGERKWMAPSARLGARDAVRCMLLVCEKMPYVEMLVWDAESVMTRAAALDAPTTANNNNNGRPRKCPEGDTRLEHDILDVLQQIESERVNPLDLLMRVLVEAVVCRCGAVVNRCMAAAQRFGAAANAYADAARLNVGGRVAQRVMAWLAFVASGASAKTASPVHRWYRLFFFFSFFPAPCSFFFTFC